MRRNAAEEERWNHLIIPPDVGLVHFRKKKVKFIKTIENAELMLSLTQMSLTQVFSSPADESGDHQEKMESPPHLKKDNDF